MKSLSQKISVGFIVPLLLLLSLTGSSQNCNNLNFTAVTTESRCIATGTVKVTITGGSGNYNVKVSGPVTTDFTSSTYITGLSAGSYTVTVKDITTNCVTDKYGVVVPGSYSDPRFTLTKTDVTCMNGTDGTVSVAGLLSGRSPFKYTLVWPSASHVGATNTTGVFTGLVAGEYAVQLKDSCGGQQTRRITVLNYTWWIDGVSISKVGCDSAKITVQVKDSKGNVNTNASLFPGFNYGVVRTPGDTVWSSNSVFTFLLNHKRSVTVVIKDPCGTMQVTTWVEPNKPSVDGSVTTTDFTCSDFTGKITGQWNLSTSTVYQLYNSSNALIGTNTNGIFTNLPYGAYSIRVKDNCYDTTIIRTFSASQPKPTLNGNANTYDKACATFTASITGGTNFTNPTYKIYFNNTTLVGTNTTGVFTGLPYGYYCIRITDGCYDTTISKCFTENTPKPSVDGSISTSNPTCSTFTATLGGQTNLTNPTFCLYKAGVLVTCNSTGKFDNITYGVEYCIKMTNDACYDTTITRCNTFQKLKPGIGSIEATDKACSTVTIKVKDPSNIFDANYCLYNKNTNALISCNTTGIFTGIPYGSYCMEIKTNPSCYDTLIRKCLDIFRDKPSIGSVSISNRACSTFTAKISGTNVTPSTYILYNDADAAIDSNTTGTFNNVKYGYYCIRIRTTCYDTIMKKCFGEYQAKPSVGSVTTGTKACSTFTATVGGQSGLYNATYKIYDTLGNLVATNTNGVFNNLPYNSYCIKITTPCYDTTITRCFGLQPDPSDVTVTASESCSFGTTDLKVTFNSGGSPYRVDVLNPVGVLVTTVNSATSPVTITGLPPLSNGQQYKVIGIEKCNGRDTALVTPKASILNKTTLVKSKCPSGVWENGATDIDIDVSSNMGLVTPLIIKKNGNSANISYTTNSGTTYSFIDLEPATYIMSYTVPSCTGKVYDTLVVLPYRFPGLQQSAAYQCDNNNFSVGAAATGGCSPFTFEIIGSIPDTPSIVTVAQNSPIFNITNGVEYSLVRLRAVDACGNATLNDVNILPMANTLIYASSDCYYDNITLSVEPMSNATYSWYKKNSANDSTLVSSTESYTIPYLLPSDTGRYICRISVNGGCLTMESYFTVSGACGFLLPGQVKLSGKAAERGTVQLSWDALQDGDVIEYIVERSAASNSSYTAIGKVTARAGGGRNMYAFTDENPLGGMNYYRLRMVTKSNKEKYTNIVGVRTSVVSSISLYPNPVSTQLNINIAGRQKDTYKLSLINAAGQVVHEQIVQNVQQATVPYVRKSNVTSGIYMLHITTLNSQETFVYKVVFK